LAHAATLNIQALETVVATQSEMARKRAQLARLASLEISSVGFHELDTARQLLRSGQRVYVSHLPRQSWARTFQMCAKLAHTGLDPVPHVPIRLLRDRRELDDVLRSAVDSGVRELMLISGDFAMASGPFSAVLEVLRSGRLQAHGFERVSLAGHPEGHPAVAAEVIRDAQIEKWRQADSMGMQVTFITQFFFDSRAFMAWARDLRTAGVQARLRAGLAGPVELGRLIRLATRCGVGTSLRALTLRGSATWRLLSDHRPDSLLQELAFASEHSPGLIDGLHFFSFGGFSRTAAWLRQQENEASGAVVRA
jgi:methylenetetrahydrofolate reductase (NADPH)